MAVVPGLQLATVPQNSTQQKIEARWKNALITEEDMGIGCCGSQPHCLSFKGLRPEGWWTGLMHG